MHCLIHYLNCYYIYLISAMCYTYYSTYYSSIFCWIYYRVVVKINLYQCQCQCQRVSCWLNANGLAVNIKKTHYMVFHRAKIKAVELPVVMQKNVVECVTRTNLLGVIIDNKLKWNDHKTYVKSIISKTIGLFYKMHLYVGRKALVNPYYSLVSGASPGFGRGGAKNFFFEIWKFACREATCCAWRSHALC